jgi:hypothetical protein
MRHLLSFVLVVTMACGVSAQDLGNRQPVKIPGTYPVNIPNPERQGGDTIAGATVTPGLPYNDSGTTAGYVDDYAGTCLYDNGAPDVVYRLTAPAGVYGLGISLCGSTYDTGLYVLNSSLVQIACNDDYCGLQSQLDNVPITAGQTYYIIVDGYASTSGAYVLSIPCYGCGDCLLTCPTASNPPEGEPNLIDNYVDDWNGGCNTSQVDPPFQNIYGAIDPGSDIPSGTAVFCGEGGWYVYDGSDYRDTDWFILHKAAADVPIVVTADAEYATYIFELSPQDCQTVAVAQQATAGPCSEASMTIGGPAGDVWFWVGSTVFADPDGGDNTYDYIVSITGLAPEVVPTQSATWGAVKALYE